MGETAMNPEAGTIEITFDQAIISLDALQRASYAVADHMTVDIAMSGSTYVCKLFRRDKAADVQELAHRMRAEVIDQTLRLRIAAETEPLRNLIFALAFSQTGLADGETPRP